MTVSDERLNEIIAGCDGVTPGPWMPASDLPAYAIMALTAEGKGGHRVVQTPNQNNYRHFGPSNGWDGISSYTNAKHIANCDPATIQSMAEELLELRSKGIEEEVAAELRDGLSVTDSELLHIRNSCEGKDGDIRIWARIVQMLVDHIRRLRALQSPAQNQESGE